MLYLCGRKGALLKKDTHVPPHYHAIEMMNPKELGFPRVSCWETGKVGPLVTVGELASQKGIARYSDNMKDRAGARGLHSYESLMCSTTPRPVLLC